VLQSLKNATDATQSARELPNPHDLKWTALICDLSAEPGSREQLRPAVINEQ
jgi:hypothetical protein